MPLLTKESLYTHLYPEIIEEIVRSVEPGNDIISRAINAGEGEAKSYLNRYDKTIMFDTSFTDEYFLMLVKDLVCYHLIKLANPNINYEVFRNSYEDAQRAFRKVMTGDIDPDWPLRQDDAATSIDDAGFIEWSSNTKRNNHF